MDEKGKRLKEQRYSEPLTVDVTTTGTHATGNYLGPEERAEPGALPPLEVAEVWFEQKDHAKQRNERGLRVEMKRASAAPGHPHIGHDKGSGELQ